MTQFSGTLSIPPEQVDLLQVVAAQLERIHAATLGRDILTLEEACQELKCSPNTLKKWRDEGWLPFFSEGKIIKFKRDAIIRAYELRFGQETHFGVVNQLKKRRS